MLCAHGGGGGEVQAQGGDGNLGRVGGSFERKGHFTAPTTGGIIQRGKLHEQKHAGGRVPGGRVPGVRGLELTLGHGKSLKAALQTEGL